MATTGLYTFNPSLGDLTIQAFQMCGVRPTALTQEHMQSALMAANLTNSEWAADGVNLWEVQAITVPLVQGTQTYSLSSNVVAILDLFITVGSGTTATDRYILPISRTEYASYANKLSQGFPTTYWHDRLLSPTLTFWPVPDGNETSFTYYALQQLQNSALANGSQVDIPMYYQWAYCLALAYRISFVWAPERTAQLGAVADVAFQKASNRNIEKGAVYIAPMLQSYWKI